MPKYLDPKTTVAAEGVDPATTVLPSQSTAEVLQEQWTRRRLHDNREQIEGYVGELRHERRPDPGTVMQILFEMYCMGFNDGGTDGVDRGARVTIFNTMEAFKSAMWGTSLGPSMTDEDGHFTLANGDCVGTDCDHVKVERHG